MYLACVLQHSCASRPRLVLQELSQRGLQNTAGDERSIWPSALLRRLLPPTDNSSNAVSVGPTRCFATSLPSLATDCTTSLSVDTSASPSAAAAIFLFLGSASRLGCIRGALLLPGTSEASRLSDVHDRAPSFSSGLRTRSIAAATRCRSAASSGLRRRQQGFLVASEAGPCSYNQGVQLLRSRSGQINVFRARHMAGNGGARIGMGIEPGATRMRLSQASRASIDGKAWCGDTASAGRSRTAWSLAMLPNAAGRCMIMPSLAA